MRIYTDGRMVVRIRRILDKRASLSPAKLRAFDERIWAEAVRDFSRAGIRLDTSAVAEGEIRLLPSGKPLFIGLERGLVNLMLTNRVPLHWQRGRGVAGVSAVQDGCHLAVVALDDAHPHRIPFVAVNTCVHELLHVLLLDIAESRPKGFTGQMRELRIDTYATRLWLFGDGAAIRAAAESYAARVQSASRKGRQ
jgi:hypothetical protein